MHRALNSSASISSLRAAVSPPAAARARSSMASLRSLVLSRRISSAVPQDCAVSGMTLAGTMPYFLTMLTIISHWPPSLMPFSTQSRVRSATGRSAQSSTLSRKKLIFSNLSQKPSQLPDSSNLSRPHFSATISRITFMDANSQQRPLFCCAVMPRVLTSTEKLSSSLAAAMGSMAALPSGLWVTAAVSTRASLSAS